MMTENSTMAMIMYQILNVSYVDQNYLNNFSASTFDSNQTGKIEAEITSSNALSKDEVARLLQVFIRPFLIVLGTYGNSVSFYIMRRGSLKDVSTCFYMAMLAIADTRE